MGRTCSTHGMCVCVCVCVCVYIKDMYTILRLENVNGTDHSEDLGVDRRIILE
jgi:hypothetical protein